MAIKVKAQERNARLQKGAEKWVYVMKTELYSTLSKAKVINEAQCAATSRTETSVQSGLENQRGCIILTHPL